MDQRRFLKLFSALSLTFIGFAALRANDNIILHAQSWLVDDKYAQRDILSEPYAKPPTNFADREQEIAYQIGEALFRTPIIMGGQAAKARLSCNSCHLNGRDNPHFLFPNISGAAGTADVSNSFFSSFLGNQNFDPVVIPDLRRKGKIPIQNEPELRLFIQGLIVREFNGNEPSDVTLNALVVYLQKIANHPDEDQTDEKASNARKQHNLSVADPLRIIDQSIDNIDYKIKNGDTETAILLIAAIRHQMGLIYERYQHPKLVGLQRNILNMSKKLALVSEQLRDDQANDAQRLIAIQKWAKEFQKIHILLIKNEDLSLYNINNLEKIL